MKNKLFSAFNAAATYAGHVVAYTPPLLALMAFSIASVSGGISSGGWFPLKSVLEASAISAAGIGLALAGYNRMIGRQDKQELKRGALAHVFNFTATSVGAGTSAILSLAALSVLTEPSTAATPAFYATTGIGIPASLALFTAGYMRLFGKNKVESPPHKPDLKP